MIKPPPGQMAGYVSLAGMLTVVVVLQGACSCFDTLSPVRRGACTGPTPRPGRALLLLLATIDDDGRCFDVDTA